MKIKLIFSLIFLLSNAVWADSLIAIKDSKDSLSSKVMVSLDSLATVMNQQYADHDIGVGTVLANYKVAKMVLKSGETRGAALVRNLKRALHHDYPITGDEGGYSFDRLVNKSRGEILKNFATEFTDNEDAGEELEKLTIILEKASHNPNYMVLSGEGSGNNTFAAIIAVINMKTSEISYIMYSNFGSDN